MKALGLAAALAIGATQVQAETPTAEQLCERSGIFITLAMEALEEGKSLKEAIASVNEALPDIGFIENYLMKNVVGKIYEMPPEQLTEDFAELSVAGCKAQLP